MNNIYPGRVQSSLVSRYFRNNKCLHLSVPFAFLQLLEKLLTWNDSDSDITPLLVDDDVCYWKCNSHMNPRVCLVVGWSVGQKTEKLDFQGTSYRGTWFNFILEKIYFFKHLMKYYFYYRDICFVRNYVIVAWLKLVSLVLHNNLLFSWSFVDIYL